MILTVGGIKGGSGKSTTAAHLAVLHSQRGYRTILLDADEQQTSYDFSQLRAERLGSAGYTCSKVSGRGVLNAARDLAKLHDAVIIDAGGHDSGSQRAALLASQVTLLPFVPGAFDLWTLETLEQLLVDIRSVNADLLALSFVNRGGIRGPLLESAKAALAASQSIEFTGVRIGARASIVYATARGLAVHESKPLDHQAAAEFEQLYERLCSAYLRTPKRTLTHA